MPDYVSTARQAMIKRRGDCEDRAIVLASLFEAKNMPYNLKASLTHYWVDYPGKKSSGIENENLAVFGKVDGKYRLKLPSVSQSRQYFAYGTKWIWDETPTSRKVLLIAGWVLIIPVGYFFSRRGRNRATQLVE